MELEYEELSNHSLYYEAYGLPAVEWPAPEAPTDIPIVVPTLLIDVMFPCCPSCKVLDEPVTELVLIEEDHPIMLLCDNQG